MQFGDSTPYDVFYWKGEKLSSACDPIWLKHIRIQFDKEYRRGQYERAYQTLHATIESCYNHTNTLQFNWMQNDLALVEYKTNDYKACLSGLNKLQNNNEYYKFPVGLKKSIAFNLSLCKTRLSTTLQSPKGKHYFHWLLAPGLFTKTTHLKALATHLRELASDAAPRDNTVVLVRYQTQHFSQLFYELITGMSNYGLHIFENRYVSFGGCVQGDCGLEGFVWVDTKLGTNIMALLSIDLSGQNIFTYNLTISSNYYTVYNVPQTAKIAVLNWSEAVMRTLMGQRNNKKINFSQFKSLRFYDVVNEHFIDLDSNW